MLPKIRSQIILRLFFTGLVLSILASVAVYFFEMDEINENVLALAREESHFLTHHAIPQDLKTPGALEEARANIEAHILKDHRSQSHFAIVEIYDEARQKVIDVVDPRYTFAKDAVEKNNHVARIGEKPEFIKFFIEDQIYFQVFLPVLRAPKEPIAYFEGIYRVDTKVTQSINTRMSWTIFQIILVIFITAAAMYPVIISLNRRTVNLTKDLAQANLGIMEVLGSAVEKRDRGTNSHNLRVTLYAIRLADAIGLRRGALEAVMKGAFLHDIGKIGISDSILLKPAALTRQETAIMESHIEHGVDILKDFNWLKDAMDIVHYHHEKYDGSGYPSGLEGTQIPLPARIFTIVDVFDALTSCRPYREAVSVAEALEQMREESGTRFDPTLLERFAAIAAELYQSVNNEDDAKLTKLLNEFLGK